MKVNYIVYGAVAALESDTKINTLINYLTVLRAAVLIKLPKGKIISKMNMLSTIISRICSTKECLCGFHGVVVRFTEKQCPN